MLLILPTPIGNLGDLSRRVESALAECELVISEDTRRTEQLLEHLHLRKKTLSFQEHNEEQRLPQIIGELTAGKKIALVTDAGMPSISDPGYRLVRACVKNKIPYSVFPGPSAVITALVGSGLPPVPFYFGGFFSNSGSKRRAEIKAACERGITSLYFESPHRLLACLKDCDMLMPKARFCVARELSKKFEEYAHGSPAELLAHFSQKGVKGEITVAFHPHPKVDENHSSEKTPILRNLA